MSFFLFECFIISDQKIYFMIEKMKRKTQKHYPFEKFHGCFLANLKTGQFLVLL